MSKWNYAREETPRAGAGDYRFEVINAVEDVSKSGKDMIVVSLKLNGTNITVKDYFVAGEWFNRKVTQFFDSTNIEEGNFEFLTWIGAVGAARFKEDENGYLKVHYYLKPEQAEKLPPWQGDMPERQTVTEFAPVNSDDDLPF
ncbi:MAG: hypothetical protein PHC64_10730 [Candidatus Gastranaerophilales bacterium]|nr:hypothetical protein [Candidatus Gastranaerophilales bacterium]